MPHYLTKNLFFKKTEKHTDKQMALIRNTLDFQLTILVVGIAYIAHKKGACNHRAIDDSKTQQKKCRNQNEKQKEKIKKSVKKERERSEYWFKG